MDKISSQKMKFGLNIIYDKDIYEAINFAARHKFSAIEVWPVAPQFAIGRYSLSVRRKIAKYGQEKNIQIQLHAPEELTFFASYPKLREGTINYYKDLVDFAKDIKAATLTIHPGKITLFNFPGGKKIPMFDSYPRYFFRIFRENLEAICGYAKNKVALCVENTDHFEEPIRRVIKKLLEKHQLFLTWDIAKSYSKNGCFKEDEVSFFLKNLKYIKNVHLHDVTSVSGHEVIGRGFVNFRFFVEKLENLDVNYIIEVRPRENVLKSRANLLQDK